MRLLSSRGWNVEEGLDDGWANIYRNYLPLLMFSFFLANRTEKKRSGFSPNFPCEKCSALFPPFNRKLRLPKTSKSTSWNNNIIYYIVRFLLLVVKPFISSVSKSSVHSTIKDIGCSGKFLRT